ncbi:GNAT family N-acetyltransferase [Shouchella patagoniensis]|uniref:GNAT family N-acetyltransferase n=1 Tax=Shouchella patagoniensis TaxID=228576 RepID=UPI000994B0D8|nr:GNAT family N-acetyltransferase [Shouchella patagoniensis]
MIREATFDDLAQIEEIAIRATKIMNSEGSDQWDKSYPTITHFHSDIKAGSLFVYENEGHIIGAIAIDRSFAPEYKSSTLRWETKQESSGTFHRLVVDPLAQKGGIAKALILFAEQLFKSAGLLSLQVDTYSLNKKAQRLFEKLGYVNVGTLQFENKKMSFYGFEKKL